MQDKMDVLKEIGNIAAAHGSIALSKILKRTITLEVPNTEIISSSKLINSVDFEKVGIAVCSKIITGFEGQVIFLLDEKNAFRFNDISYDVDIKEKRSGVFTEMGMSLIKEIGSIVTSAFVSAISKMFRNIIILGPPMLISGTMNEIMNITVFSGSSSNNVLLVETIFEQKEESIRGIFFLVLTAEAADFLERECAKLIEDNKE